jgi:hypothetical protein
VGQVQVVEQAVPKRLEQSEGTLTFIRLPSDLRSIEEKVWTLGPELGLVLRDFGMDPSQDLLVLIQSPNW